MSESRAKSSTTRLKRWYDSPYGRMGTLVVGIVLVLGLVFVINVVVRGLGGDEKRLADALVESLRQPRINGTLSVAQQNQQSSSLGVQGTFSVERQSQMSFDGKLVGTSQNQSIEIPLKAYGDLPQSTAYVRVSDAQKVAELFGGFTAIRSDIDSIATKINDKWVRIKQKDSQAANCTTKLFETVSRDNQASGELAKLYLGHRFITVSSRQDVSETKQVYSLSFDQDALKGFIEGLKQTTLFKSTKGCDSSYSFLDTSDTTATQQTAATKQSPTETKITVENGKFAKFVSVSNNSGKVDAVNVTFDYTGGDPLKAPTENIIETSELQTELLSIGKAIQSAAAASQSAQ